MSSSSRSTNLLFSSSSSPPVSSSKGGSDSGGNGNNGGVAATFDANAVLAVDPSIVNIMTVYEEEYKPEQQQTTVDNSTSTSSSFLSSSSSSSSSGNQQLQQQLLLQSLPFVDMFRGSADYIANHRNTIAVYQIPGGLVDTYDNNITSTDGSGSVSRNHNTVFRDLMNDVALTWLLGMRIVIVIVAGCRQQIEKRITKLKKEKPAFTDVPADVVSSYNPQTLRVTVENILRIVKEEAGYVRFEVERELARSLQMQGGASTLPTPISLVTPTIIMTNNNNNNFMTMVVNGDDIVMTDGGGTGTTTSGSIIGSGARVPSTGYDGNVVSANFYSAQYIFL